MYKFPPSKCQISENNFQFVAEGRRDKRSVITASRENWINIKKWIFFLFSYHHSISLPHCMLNWILSTWNIFLLSLEIGMKSKSFLFFFFIRMCYSSWGPFSFHIRWMINSCKNLINSFSIRFCVSDLEVFMESFLLWDISY